MQEKHIDEGPIEAFLGWASSLVGENISYKRVRSGNHSFVYELSNFQDQVWFLKIGSGLENEKRHLEWLRDKVAVSDVVGFMVQGQYEALLKTSVVGIDLAELAKTLPAEEVLKKLSGTLKLFHSISLDNWPGEKSTGDTLLHGDACLPNFIFSEDGTFKGYIDLVDVHAGRAEEDLSAAVWSLQFNLGSGYGLPFLQEYGIPGADEAMAERLRRAYETDVLHDQLPQWK